jgi:hypothetical protein
MKESKLLGSLMPPHPAFAPIIEEIRQKDKIPEISPDDDPITEIYLDDEIIPLEDFRKEIETIIQKNTNHLPPQLASLYERSKRFLGKPSGARTTTTKIHHWKVPLG